jgi:hypothetical protein
VGEQLHLPSSLLRRYAMPLKSIEVLFGKIVFGHDPIIINMYRVHGILLIVVIAAAAHGCAASIDLETEGESSPLRRAAGEALTRAWQAMARQGSLDAGLVWNLQQVQRMRPDPRQQPLVDEAVGRLAGTPYERLVNPKAPHPRLPEDPGEGSKRLSNYLKAPLGEPRERAIEWITEYVAEPGFGYNLTHQFLVLQWARHTGLELPDSLLDLQPELLRLIEEEQKGARTFSDMYAERTGLILMYGSPPREVAEVWILAIVEKQLEDGMWDASRGGASGRGSKHATGWCMVALAAFLESY